MGQLEILGYLARRFSNSGLLGVWSNIEGKMTVADRRIQLLEGKAPPQLNHTSIWEMSEKIENIPAMGVNELAC